MSRIRRFPKILNEDQLNIILDTIEKSPSYMKNVTGHFLKWRDSTAILLMFYAILRPGEALQLRWDDVDEVNRIIKVKPYTNKERNDLPAVLTTPAGNILNKYKEKCKEFNITSEYIFPSVWTKMPITTDAFGKRFQGIVKEAGLSKVEWYTESGKPVYTYRLYTMRHSACTKIYKKTGSEEAVTQLARHIRPESAHVYIHLSTDDKKDIADSVFS